jgi:hypothetical protein
MCTSFIVSGFLVHTPFGPRKSGIPDSVLMPAPVRMAIFSEFATYAATRSVDPASRSATFDPEEPPAPEDAFQVVLASIPEHEISSRQSVLEV